jgi:hypothetical protein
MRQFAEALQMPELWEDVARLLEDHKKHRTCGGFGEGFCAWM